MPAPVLVPCGLPLGDKIAGRLYRLPVSLEGFLGLRSIHDFEDLLDLWSVAALPRGIKLVLDISEFRVRRRQVYDSRRFS